MKDIKIWFFPDKKKKSKFVRYIFAILLFKCKREYFWNEEIKYVLDVIWKEF